MHRYGLPAGRTRNAFLASTHLTSRKAPNFPQGDFGLAEPGCDQLSSSSRYARSGDNCLWPSAYGSIGRAHRCRPNRASYNFTLRQHGQFVNPNRRGRIQPCLAPSVNREIEVGDPSAESKRTTAGRNLPPGVWRKSIRIRMTSPGRSVMNQQFVDRIFVRVGRLKLLPARNTPGYISFGGAPLEHHLNLRPRGNL